jgi:hypothetical protein
MKDINHKSTFVLLTTSDPDLAEKCGLKKCLNYDIGFKGFDEYDEEGKKQIIREAVKFYFDVPDDTEDDAIDIFVELVYTMLQVTDKNDIGGLVGYFKFIDATLSLDN